MTYDPEWRTERLKYNSYIKGRVGWENLRADEFTESGPYLVTGMHFRNGGVDWDACYHVSDERYSIAPEIQLRPDDLLITKDGTIGKLAHLGALPGPACLNSHLLVIRPLRDAYVPRFMYYLLGSSVFDEFILQRQSGTTFFGLTQEAIENFPAILPPLRQQRVIADLLDLQTEIIDALVMEQQRLIELIEEMRQAVISHAITRGLNSLASMKESGIEWLGKVPRHWCVASVGYRYSVQLGKMLDSSKITGENLRQYLRVFDVQWDEINTDDLPQMDFNEDARKRYRLIPGDVLVNEGGSYPGRSAIWSLENLECYYQKALHRMRPHHPTEDNTRFLFYVMYWAANQGVFVAGGNETTIEHLPAEKLRRYRFAFPPITEQRSIASFLDTELVKFKKLNSAAVRAIGLLQEHRVALISAAVTGQIDVRNYRPQEDTAVFQ